MSKRKPYISKRPKPTEVQEPMTFYADNGKKITFFQSHEQQEIYELKEMTNTSPVQRLLKLEEMRKFFLKQFLLPNGDWPPIERTITITKLTAE